MRTSLALVRQPGYLKRSADASRRRQWPRASLWLFRRETQRNNSLEQTASSTNKFVPSPQLSSRPIIWLNFPSHSKMMIVAQHPPCPRRHVSRTGLTRVEIAVIFAVIGVLLSLILVPDSHTATRREIERRTRNWQPTAADRQRPDSSLIVTDANVVGEWAVRRHLNGSTLSISRKSPTEYSVAFSTGGCLGHCDLQRTARFENGVLTLNEPVAEYLPVVYDTLYAIRANGQVLLLPAAFVDDFEDGLTDDEDELTDDLIMRMYVYRRAESIEEASH